MQALSIQRHEAHVHRRLEHLARQLRSIDERSSGEDFRQYRRWIAAIVGGGGNQQQRARRVGELGHLGRKDAFQSRRERQRRGHRWHRGERPTARTAIAMRFQGCWQLDKRERIAQRLCKDPRSDDWRQARSVRIEEGTR